MSTPILPFAVWLSGTNENSIPANDNALRCEILFGLVISQVVTAQPVSPADGDIYVIPPGATGAQWATFDTYDLVIYKSGTWYAYGPVEGIIVNINGALYEFIGSSGFSGIGGGGGSKFVNVAMSDMTTDLTTGTAKAAWFAPENGTLVSVYIGVHDPSSSGIVRVDMNDTGGTVFTTRPAIDATESTSLTGTNAVLDGTVSFSRGDKFTFDIDDAGTDAKGLQVCIEYS